jgi:hypothetical protein
MTKKSNTPAPATIAFDFTRIDAGARPASNASADAKNNYYHTRAALQIDALLDAIDAHPEAAKSAVVTWIGQCVGAKSDFNFKNVAQAHALYREQVSPERAQKRVDNAINAATSLSGDELAAFLAALQAKLAK